MKIEIQCCNLEQAKKLKELGVTQDCFLYWHKGIISNTWILINSEASNINWEEDYAAYTASELIVMMPNHSHIGDWYMRYCWKGISFGYNGKNVGKDHIEEPWYKPEQSAEALAFLLIYLLENNLTTPQEVNQRLK